MQRLQFCTFRLKKGKELRDADAVREVKKNIHLIKSPAGRTFLLQIAILLISVWDKIS